VSNTTSTPWNQTSPYECFACPPLYTSLRGITINDCYCPDGTYPGSNSIINTTDMTSTNVTTCLSCRAHHYCTSQLEKECPALWSSQSGSVSCTVACPRCTVNGSCPLGTKGLLCDLCQPNYFMLGKGVNAICQVSAFSQALPDIE
jgi:hypothetical protein